MKKVLSFLLIFALMVSVFAVSASAENFVPSITVKPAPEVETTPDDEGREVIGHVVDPNGNILSTEYEDCIVITSVVEAGDTDKVPDEVTDLLLKIYNEITHKDYRLFDMSEELNKLVAETLGEDYDANSLVIKDFFDVTAVCEDLKTLLPVEGNTITLELSSPLSKETPVFVMAYVNDEWVPVKKAVNNGDDTITVTFEDFCPVAVLVPEEGYEDTPQTGDTSSNIIWVIVMAVSVALIVVLVVLNKRSARKHELDQ